MKGNSVTFKFRWITKWEEIESTDFQLQWLNWYNSDKNQSIFGCPELCMAWLKTYRSLRELTPIFCIAKRGELVYFYPMVIWIRNWRSAFSKIIVPVGYSDFDYHDAIVFNQTDETADIIDFFRALKEEIDKVFKFDEIHLNGIRTHLPAEVGALETDIAPFAELKHYENSDAFLASLSTSVRGDLKRQLRRLKEVGKFEYLEYADNETARCQIEGLLKAHKERWPRAYKAENFHSNLIEVGLSQRIVHFSVLTVNGEIISWHLGFESQTTYYYYMPAINVEWRNYSPGKIHLLLLNERAISKKLEIFDHLRGEENYKAGWTNSCINLFEIKYINRGIISHIKKAIINIKQLLNG